MRTSPVFGPSISTSSIESGERGSWATAARVFITAHYSGAHLSLRLNSAVTPSVLLTQHPTTAALPRGQAPRATCLFDPSGSSPYVLAVSSESLHERFEDLSA